MIPIVIVAHPKREQMALGLLAKAGAEAIVWDNYSQGCEASHAKAWQYVAGCDERWVVFLEDDAKPCEFFREQLHQVLSAATPPIVSLYLGRGSPDQWQLPIAAVIGAEACFIRSDTLLSTVGYAVRSNLLASMIDHIPRISTLRQLELPEAITNWAKKRGYPISYSRPSIVDHLDVEPITPTEKRHDGQARTELRKAWLFDWRPSGTWNSTYVELPHYDLDREDKVAEHEVVIHKG